MAGTVVLSKQTLPSHKDSSCRCVVSTNLLHYYDISGLLSRTVKALYYQQRHTPCTVLAEQCWRPLSQQTHIPAWSGSTCWTTRTKHQLQPCKSLPILSLEHYKDSMAQGPGEHVGFWHYWWFHWRMSGGTIGDARKEQRTPATGTILLWPWCEPMRKFTAW